MRILLVIVLAAAMCSFFPTTASADRTIGELEFTSDFEVLLNKAQETEKSIVLKFYTDWCHWCKVMDDSTFPDGYVQKFLKNFELGMINAEVDTLLAARYGVRSYPTTLLLKADGVEIDRMVGYYPPEDFVTQVLNAYAGTGTLDYYLEKLADEPPSASLNYEVGQKYRWKGDYDKARTYFEQVVTLDSDNSQALAAQACFNLGHMQYKLKDYLAAIEIWRRLPRDYASDPISVDAEIMIAYAYQQAEDFESAKREYNSFMEKYPDTDEREWIGKQLAEMNGTQ